jgi:hypothetical protein
MEQLMEMGKQIEKELNKIEPLRIAEQKTGVPKLYLAAGAAAIVAIFVWLALGVTQLRPSHLSFSLDCLAIFLFAVSIPIKIIERFPDIWSSDANMVVILRRLRSS